MKKIYIIGPVGSGKTTLANNLSLKLSITFYELDKIVWDDEKKTKRSNEEIGKLFNSIILNDAWIIEDVGRNIFIKGIINADIVYYLNLNKFTIYYRCIKRWIKQIIGIEKYNYKPTLKGLKETLSYAKKDFKNKEYKLNIIKENAKKYKIIRKKDFYVLKTKR